MQHVENETYTLSDVKAKMAEIGVVGYSSMGKFSASERMRHLSEIERVMISRRNGEVHDAMTSLLGEEMLEG
jgi:hypothetical protein